MLELPGSKFWVKDPGFAKKSCIHGLGWIFFILKWFFRIFWSKESDCVDRQRNVLSCDKKHVQESRADKARRKALEKKQAKVEREVMEEEERRQREEIAKLVEEHKKLRSKKCESENSNDKVSCAELKRETKVRDAKKRDRRREKDKLSGKSISEVEELENTPSTGVEKKRIFDKKKEIERQKAIVQSTRLQSLEGGKSKHFSKTPKILSSSSPVARNTGVGNRNSDSTRNQHANANSTQKADRQSVPNKVQPNTNVPKKSWRQLFACSSTVKSEHDISGSLNDSNEQATSYFSMPIVGCLSPIGKSISPPTHNSKGDTRTSSQPCNVVNQLKKIQVEIGTNLSEWPSPFDSPLSRSSVLEDKTIIGTPKSKKSLDFESDESTNALDFETWEMWGTPLVRYEPKVQGGFCDLFSSVVQGKPNCYSDCSLLQGKPNQLYHSVSHTAEESPLLHAVPHENTYYDDFGNVGAFSHLSPHNTNFNRSFTWAHDRHQLPLPALPFNLIDSSGWNDSCPNNTSDVYPFELPQTNGFPREWAFKKLSNSNIGRCNMYSTSPDIRAGKLTNRDRIYM